MKKQTQTNLILRSLFTLTLALAAWLPSTASAEEPMKPMKGGEHQLMLNQMDTPPGTVAGDQLMTKSNLMERCVALKEEKEKMMADIKTQNIQLATQIANMNGAPESKKVGLLAAVVTRMNDQQSVMDARKAKMEQDMMKHMLQHMQMSSDSMSECPMMKAMMGIEEKPAADHKEHHAEPK